MSTIIPQPAGSSPFDAIREVDANGRDFWSARRLQPLMGYRRWANLLPAIERAKSAARNQGASIEENFPGSQKDAGQAGPGAQDYELSRFAAYLVAMNGDPNKPEVAAAQAYFAVQTHRAEVAQIQPAAPALPADYEEALVALLGKVRDNKELTAKVAELEPAAQAYEVLASAKGDYSLRDAAYILNRDPGIQTGQNRLMVSIRKFQMVGRGDVPYASHQTHLTQRAQSYKDRESGEELLAKPQLRITVAGLRYLHKRLGGQAPLRFDQLPFAEGDAA
ncbi:phage antirepressor KilAC domain-containing protein [Streptomycetaceae bacterium NBC_01309]